MAFLMQHLKSIIALTLLAGLAAMIIPRSTPLQAAGGAPVTVLNTPLPVTGTVNIGNTPTVNLGGGSSVGINGQVQIGNTLTVKDEGTPFATTLCDALYKIHCNDISNYFIVESGHHLIIEYVSGNCFVTNGADLRRPRLYVTTGGNQNQHFIFPFPSQPSVPVSQTNATLYTEFSEQTRLYADPSTNVIFTADAESQYGSPAQCSLTISGRLTTP